MRAIDSSPTCCVSLCVNDPDDGTPTGHVCAVHFEDDAERRLELAGDMLYDRDNPSCSIDQARKRLRVGRFVYPIRGYRQWYGNWCWDGVSMTLNDAQRLAKNLTERRFTIDAEDQGQPFLVTDFSPASTRCE
jgi:hypothetical protein